LLEEFRRGIDTENIPSKTLKQEENYLKGIHVALPKSRRDNKERPPVIPE